MPATDDDVEEDDLDDAPEPVEFFDAAAEVEALEHDPEYQPFPFKALDGTIYYLPHPGTLETAKAAEIQRAQDDEDAADVLWDLLDELAPGISAALGELPQAVTMRFLSAWFEMMGVDDEDDDSGKLSSAPSAPNRAQRRSKQTSRPGGSTSGRGKSGRRRR